MPSTHFQLLANYLLLARAAGERQRGPVRARLLVLAAALAKNAGLEPLAEFCRQDVLQHNPGHLLGHFPNMQTATQAEAFQSLLTQLVRRYNPERVEQLLSQLKIDPREGVPRDGLTPEILARLAGSSWDEITRQFPDFTES